MNFKPGGQQPVIQEGFIHSKGKPQPIIFSDNYVNLAVSGLPKGMKQILIEWELYHPKLHPICKDPKGKKICKSEGFNYYLRENVPHAHSNVSISTIWRFHGKCILSMDAYHAGYIYGMKDFQYHVYQSHNKVKKKDVNR